uniref:Baseplate wedge protein n=1 Tax=Myoviridae sp. ctrMq22 TaxID=2825181 RepID=A0A8S5NWZ3_9CAUD|nr:MAG TPA: Baseplate wedge protein [Myoviridae sp. ctrMq22]
MFHLDNNSGVSAMPPLGAVQSSAPRWFTEGGGGVPASYPGAAWFNMIQAELLNLCAAYGISPDKANLNQLKLAIEAAVNQRAPLASPAFSGVPTAPTASQSTNNTQIATTAFVKAALAALVDSSPAALDTLNELAAALGNDPNFATTMTNALAGKQPLDNTLTALSGKDVAGILSYLGLGEAAKRAVGTGENQIPDMSSFPLTVTGDLSSRKLTTKLPNGLILKAVNGNADSNGWFSLNFDTPFPSEILFCWAADRLPVSAQNQLSVINANINLSAVDHVAGYARAITIGGGVGPVAASISAYALGR